MGHMLGSSCNSCCTDPGPCPCLEGQLPDTVTVTFSGPQGTKEQGPPLLPLRFAACFGSGAEGFATAPGGVPEEDIGPISGATVTKAGSGYAKLGRVAPTLTITGGSGSGATITPTLAQLQDECGCDYWVLDSVGFAGGTGYVNEDDLTISVADGDTEIEAAGARVFLDGAEPELTISGNATATVNVENAAGGVWEIDADNPATITNGGSGYSEGGAIAFVLGQDDVEVAAAAGIARVVHDEPTAVLEVFSLGEGAELEAVWELLPENEWPAPHKKTYALAGVNVINGGTGYEQFDFIVATFASVEDGFDLEEAYIDVDEVDENGAILSVLVAPYVFPIEEPAPGGRYVGRRTDALHSVLLTQQGSYYKDDGAAFRVDVLNPGVYYREDAGEPPCVAEINITVLQGWPGQSGSGATFTAVVDDDTSSETFGQITSVAVTNGGTDYLGWRWIYSCDCDWIYGEEPPQDHTVVAWRDLQWIDGDPCRYLVPRCYPAEDSVTNNAWVRTGPFALIRAVVTSDLVPFATASIEGPEGKPGRDNGPIVAVGAMEDEQPLRGYAYPGRVQDQPSIIAGAEVAISATMSQQFEPGGATPYWIVTAVTVPPGIEGFSNNQFLELESTTQEPLIDIPQQGRPGNLEDRLAAAARAVVDEDGFLVGITILSGGKFYNESADVPVISPPVTVQVEQYLPSQGSGAEIEATVNTDLDDRDFGTVTLAITNAGDGYLGGYTGADFVTVTYPGPNSPPTVRSARVASPIGTLFGGCLTTLTADAPITNCDEFSFEATFGDQTATVSPGGEVAPPFEGSNKCCHKCFVCCPEMPSQVVATFTREANEGYALRVEDNPSGLSISSNTGPGYNAELLEDAYYTVCPEHEIEVVWDVEDLHAENRCSVDFCEDLPEEESCSSSAVIQEDTRLVLWDNGRKASRVSGNYEPPATPPFDTVPELTTLGRRVGAGVFNEFPFGDNFTTVVRFIGRDYNSEPHGCLVEVAASSTWFKANLANFPLVNRTSSRVRIYRKPETVACQSVPGVWDFAEEFAYANPDSADLRAAPEDIYSFRAQYEIAGFGFLVRENLVGLARRICKNYEVEVEFQ